MLEVELLEHEKPEDLQQIHLANEAQQIEKAKVVAVPKEAKFEVGAVIAFDRTHLKPVCLDNEFRYLVPESVVLFVG